MSIVDFRLQLEDRGILLFMVDGHPRFHAKPGAVTQQISDQLRARRKEIVARLKVWPWPEMRIKNGEIENKPTIAQFVINAAQNKGYPFHPMIGEGAKAWTAAAFVMSTEKLVEVMDDLDAYQEA